MDTLLPAAINRKKNTSPQVPKTDIDTTTGAIDENKANTRLKLEV